MKNKIVDFLSLIVVLPVFVHAASVTVQEATFDNDSLLTFSERQHLSDVLREQAVKALPAELNYTIITKDSSNIAEHAETADSVAQNYVVQTHVGRTDSSLSIRVELYGTLDSGLVGSFDGLANSLENIEALINEKSPDLFKKIIEKKDSTSAVPTEPIATELSVDSNQVLVSIITNPEGAALNVDGSPASGCSQTPCNMALDTGEHHIQAMKTLYFDADTTINILQMNQEFVIDLKQNYGTMLIKPQLLQDVGSEDGLKIALDSELVKPGEFLLAPGPHSIRISHPCYNSVDLNVEIENQKNESYTDSLTRAKGGLSLNAKWSDSSQAMIPVYVDGEKVGTTPYSGDISLCAAVEVEDGDARKVVSAELRNGETVSYVYNVENMKKPNADSALTKNREEKKTLQKDSAPLFKRLWGGAFVGASYNDFYDTKFGFGNLEDGPDYILKEEGADDLLGNYWGVGFNAGVSGLFFINPYVALHGDVSFAYRRGSGKSDASVKLYWNDSEKMPEKSDLKVEYTETQMNIDIPLFVRVVKPKIFYVEAGPMVSFNLISHNESSVADLYGTEEFEDDDGLNIFEFDAAFGLGVMRDIGKYMLDFNMRFVLGITPLSDADDSPKTWQGQFNLTFWFL